MPSSYDAIRPDIMGPYSNQAISPVLGDVCRFCNAQALTLKHNPKDINGDLFSIAILLSKNSISDIEAACLISVAHVMTGAPHNVQCLFCPSLRESIRRDCAVGRLPYSEALDGGILLNSDDFIKWSQSERYLEGESLNWIQKADAMRGIASSRRLIPLGICVKAAGEGDPTVKIRSYVDGKIIEVPKRYDPNIRKKRDAPSKYGRPTTRDHEADRQLLTHWESAKKEGSSLEEFAEAKGKTKREVVLALDSIKHRMSRGY